MQEANQLVACHECDAVYRRLRLRPREIAHCERCGSELERNVERQAMYMLPLVLTSLIVFIIANSFPIVEIEVQGLHSATTLLGAVLVLYGASMPLVASLVLATTILAPLLQLLILLYLLLPRAGVLPGFNFLARLLLRLRPWGMIEVFLLGVLVALVKLSSMARVLPGVALWAFAALTILLVLVLAFNPRYLWRTGCTASSVGSEQPCGVESWAGAMGPLGSVQCRVTVDGLGLIACHDCGSVWQQAAAGAACACCGSTLHRRRPDSVQRTWAFLIAAGILYLPANLLPVMVTSTLISEQRDTIMSGIIYFWVSGAWELAVVVFIASFMVPLFKLAALTLMVLSTQKRSTWRLLQRARLYRIVEFIGRWSMLDVFVVALLTGLVQIQGFATINAGPGVAAFGAVVVLTMLASLSFDPRLAWDPAPQIIRKSVHE